MPSSSSPEPSFLPSHYLPPSTPAVPSSHQRHTSASSAKEYEYEEEVEEADSVGSSPSPALMMTGWGDATLLKDTKLPWGMGEGGGEMSVLVPGSAYPPTRRAMGRGKGGAVERMKVERFKVEASAKKGLQSVKKEKKGGKGWKKERDESPSKKVNSLQKRGLERKMVVEETTQMTKKTANMVDVVPLTAPASSSQSSHSDGSSQAPPVPTEEVLLPAVNLRSSRRSRRQREEAPLPVAPFPAPQLLAESVPGDPTAAAAQKGTIAGRQEIKSKAEVKKEKRTNKEVKSLAEQPSDREVVAARQESKIPSPKKTKPAKPASPTTATSASRPPPVPDSQSPDLASSAPTTLPLPSPNLPADETAPLPPPTPATLRRQQLHQPLHARSSSAATSGEGDSSEASFGGLMEKLRVYKERIGVGKAGSSSASSVSSSETASSVEVEPPIPAPTKAVEAEPSSSSSSSVDADLAPTSSAQANIPPAPSAKVRTRPATVPQIVPPAVEPHSKAGPSLFEKLEAAARQSVRSVLPPPSPTRPTRPVIQSLAPRPEQEEPIPTSRSHAVLPTADPAPPAPPVERPTTTRKRPTVHEETTRPAKKSRPSVVKSNKENASHVGNGWGPPRRRSPRKVSPRKAKQAQRAVLAPAEGDATNKGATKEVGGGKAKAAVVQRKGDEGKKHQQELEQAAEKVRLLEEKKRQLQELLHAKHRVPSTAFEPTLPHAVHEKHKHAFASTRAVWEARAAAPPPPPQAAKVEAKKSNYHPPPNWAALHAAEEARKATLLAKLHSSHKPIQPRPIPLATEARAKEREGFERLIKEKEQLLEELKEQRRLEQEKEEREEVERIRRELDEKMRGNVHDVPGWMRRRKEELRGSG